MRCISIHPPKQSPVSGWLKKLAPASTDVELADDDGNGDALPPVLRKFRNLLRRRAERGTPAERNVSRDNETYAWIRRCADAGVNAFARLGPCAGGNAEALLRMHYLCMQYERVGEGASIDM